MEDVLSSLLLVLPQFPALLPQRDRVLFTVDIAREILRGPPDRQQRLLEPAAFAGVHHDGVLVDLRTQHPGCLLVPLNLGENSPIMADQHQPVRRVVVQFQAPVSADGVGHVEQQRGTDRESGEPHQGVDDRFRVVSGGARVPQPQLREPVGVHVLGGSLEFCEHGDLTPALLRLRVIDLQKQRVIALHDQWAVSHRYCPPQRSGTAAP